MKNYIYPKYLFGQVEKNNVKLIKKYLQNGMHPNVYRDKNNEYSMTLLECAAKHAGHEMVKILLDAGAVIVNAKKYGTRIPTIIYAAENPDVEVLKTLVAHGADVNPNPCFHHPLNRAAEYNHFEAVKFLVEAGADINAMHNPEKESVVYSPIYYAILHENEEMFMYLAKRGAKLGRSSAVVQSPLDNACANGRVNMVKRLIEMGVDINERSVHRLPLETVINSFYHCAEESKENLKQVLKTLLEHGAVTVDEYRMRYGAKTPSIINLVQDTELLDVIEQYSDEIEEESRKVIYKKRFRLLIN